jgi:hypothetical protein
VVAPWVGVLVGAAVAVIAVWPRSRVIVMLAPAALLALCMVYIVAEQYRYRYPSVFEWPTVFPHARTLAWIAVVLLAADAVIEVLRSRFDGGGGAGRGDEVDAARGLDTSSPVDDDLDALDDLEPIEMEYSEPAPEVDTS